jgi:hypothetical protein
VILGCAALGVGLGALARAESRNRGGLAARPVPNLISRSQHRQAMAWVGGEAIDFEYNRTSPYVLAKNVCIWRRFDNCADYNDVLHHDVKNTPVSLNYTFEHFLKSTRMTSAQEKAQVPGATVLFTVAHCRRYFRWNNLEHFVQELIALANFMDRYGDELAENALVWEASTAMFTGTNNNGFATDWYIESLKSILPPGVNTKKTVAANTYTCEQIPLATGGGGDALCFESLVAFPEPRTCAPPAFNPSVCNHFKSRTYQKFGFSPAPDVSKHVLALIRTDSQGWSNHDDAANDIAEHVKQVGGTTTTVFLNRSSMSLQEQVRWFMDAGVVVTTHGAHETNLMFARAGSFHIEYFKRNHLSVDFSTIALSCGVNYIAVHAKDTVFPSASKCSYNRHFVDLPMPLDFQLELLPALQVALVVQGHVSPFMIRTVSNGWNSADSVEEALIQYNWTEGQCR